MNRILLRNIQFILIILLSLPTIALAETSQFGFTTEERSVPLNTISEAITVQSQDSGGNSSPATETIDLTFTSTSGTGEFVNSSGNAATKYMSTNTSNRTFYYRDSTEGVHTITVKGVGRVSHEEWSASQSIKVGTGGANTATQNSGNSESKSGSGVSSTYVQVGGSPSLEVSIGSDRATSPGTPISFQATIKKQSNIGSKIDFNWSFGDGHVGIGERVEHAYKYPGQYAVVLNARAGEVSSLSRVKVSVGEAKIKMTESDAYIDITNTDGAEVNLFKWKIEKNGIGFIFQPDTIILPRATMRFDKSMLNMRGDVRIVGTRLTNSVGDVVAEILYEVPEPAYQVISYNTKKSTVEPEVMETEKVVSIEADNTQESAVIYEATKRGGVLSRIGSFFKSLFSSRVD